MNVPEVIPCITPIITTMVLLTAETSVKAEMHIAIPGSPQPYERYKTQTRGENGSSEMELPERALDSYTILTTQNKFLQGYLVFCIIGVL